MASAASTRPEKVESSGIRKRAESAFPNIWPYLKEFISSDNEQMQDALDMMYQYEVKVDVNLESSSLCNSFLNRARAAFYHLAASPDSASVQQWAVFEYRLGDVTQLYGIAGCIQASRDAPCKFFRADRLLIMEFEELDQFMAHFSVNWSPPQRMYWSRLDYCLPTKEVFELFWGVKTRAIQMMEYVSYEMLRRLLSMPEEEPLASVVLAETKQDSGDNVQYAAHLVNAAKTVAVEVGRESVEVTVKQVVNKMQKRRCCLLLRLTLPKDEPSQSALPLLSLPKDEPSQSALPLLSLPKDEPSQSALPYDWAMAHVYGLADAERQLLNDDIYQGELCLTLFTVVEPSWFVTGPVARSLK